MGLDDYSKKRDFAKTPEPAGSKEAPGGTLRFVVQRHDARRLHYDLRLEMDGVLKSWAVPKGPSMNPKDKRLAIQTEDHPVKYLDFEGTIPEGNYGAGRMDIWDKGTYKPLKGGEKELIRALDKGDLKIQLHGTKLRGTFALVRMDKEDKKDQWLLIKKKDEFATELGYDAEDIQDDEDEEAGSVSLNKLVKPMLAMKTSAIFSKAGWVYEIKWDGYRVMANIQNGTVHLYSRNGITYNQKYPSLVTQLQAVPHDALLDGEVVVVNEEGIPDFQKLQHYSEEIDGELRYYVFDILYLNGHDTTSLPLLERKSLIPEVIEDIPQVYYCDHVEGMGKAFYEKTIKKGLEGVIAKKADSLYWSGARTENWLKIKSKESQEALICGYTTSQGNLFGSLILGLYENEKLIYIGNCGSGFNRESQRQLLNQFKPLIIKSPPFEDKINLKGRKAIWLNPELVCEVQFSQWTKMGLLRHPVFKGLRTDKMPPEIHKETETDPSAMKKKTAPKKTPKTDTLEINGFDVPVSNLEKVYWPDEKINKYQLISYYIEISDYILPFLKNRPQNLHRHPNGIKKESFYQKDMAETIPEWIETVSIYSESTEKDIDYMLCQNEATLVYMANLGCIEINPWNSKKDSLDRPDYAVIDLDPSDKNTFEEVIEVAQVAHEILDTAKIKHFCKTSGSTGLHIYIPMGSGYSYAEARDFVKIICHLIHDNLPKLTSMERAKDSRKGKIYLDYLQNARGQTLAAPYCVRPKPGAPVSAPLEWKEVKKGLAIQDFTLLNMAERVKKKPDLFLEVLGKGIDMKQALERLGD
ncbi:DNA ligase D [Negadavirga shengliensis]|uniref:DNA ligase (ATP) n=1 Tax=Negadavirga shengliensis TaxID=1389218 RepID=A0ABV9T4D5_9BACT